MRVLRQALPWTWAFLLFLRAENGATETGARPATPDIEKWLTDVSGDTFYGQDTTHDTTPSLLGREAYCVKMTFLETRNGLPNILSLKYIDASNPAESYTWTNASLDIKVESKKTVTFTFTRAEKTGLTGRKVQYELLTLVNQDHSSCSILVTSRGQRNCSYWVMYMGQPGTIPKWCKPPTPKGTCKVEIYTLTKPVECGVDSAEKEGEDEGDSEESDEDESQEEKWGDEEDEEWGSEDEDE
uniref:Putative lipocalin n=1 Tax=Ixodes ricinus TaxID=34613 RepID=A0A6B0V5F2_IXORI